MADDTASMIEQLGVGRVDIVGHSDGANIALLLAWEHPLLVRRLVISGANLRSRLPAEEVQRRRGWTSHERTAKLQPLADGLRRGSGLITRRSVRTDPIIG